MNLLEIFGVIVVLFFTVLFWIMVFDEDGDEAVGLGVIVFVLWFGMFLYFKDFFTTPLW